MKRSDEDIDTQRDEHVRKQGNSGHPHTRERGLRRDQPCRHPDLEFQPLEKREDIPVVSAPFGVLCYGCPRDLTSHSFKGFC